MTAPPAGSAPLRLTPMEARVEHPELGLLGCVVINASVWRRAVGGIRMSPEVTPRHVADLAATMTYKFGFLGMPFAGAKGGIVASSRWFPHRKEEVLRYVGAALRPIIRERIYTPGTDLGMGPRECALLLAGAGEIADSGVPDQSPGAGDEAGFPTGLTVFLAATAALEHLGRPVAGATVAVEGFGKVGAAAVRLFAEAGARVVAISTVEGALHDPRGLDVAELLRLRATHGDRVVHEYAGASRPPREAVLTLPVDVLSPCGAQWSIHRENSDQVACRVLCPGANCVVHPEIRTAFDARADVYAVPDFVANCGSVLDGNLPGGRAANERLLRRHFGGMVRALTAAAAREGITIGTLARRMAEDAVRRAEANPRQSRARERAVAWMTRVAEQPLTPARAAEVVAGRLAREWTPIMPDSRI